MSKKIAKKTPNHPVQKYKVIGTRPVRQDASDKVTGKALFGADIQLPGMLIGSVLRSPYAHAIIHSINTEKAEMLPGVRAVITYSDLPELPPEKATNELEYQRQNTLARNKVLYQGHAVAAVAADLNEIARQALDLIQVDYEILPCVLDVRQAMQDDSIVLIDGLSTNDMGIDCQKPTNIASHQVIQQGSLEQGFQEAAVVIEREFTTATVHQGYLEPQNATAIYDSHGKVTIWCSTQGSFGVSDQVSEILNIPVNNIKVIPLEIGGGFGGKNNVYLEPLAVLLSKKSGNQPVQMVMGYPEVLSATGPTSGSYVKVRMGADRSGKITAAQAWMMYEAGAFPGSPVDSGAGIIFSPYRIENLQIDMYDVVVNKPRTSSYRAPGSTNANFACETVIDELAIQLGLDPLEFRMLNCVREGDRRGGGQTFSRIGCLDTLEAAKNHPHYSARLEGPCRGRGVSTAYWGNYGGKSSVSACLQPDGIVKLMIGSIDLSGTRTTLAMQLAETLGIPLELIDPQVADTHSVGYTEGSYGSRTTFATGLAVVELGRQLKSQMVSCASKRFGIPPDQIHYHDRNFQFDDTTIPFEELARKLVQAGEPISVEVSVFPDNESPSFATHIVDVEVDPLTGRVKILRYTAVQDVGKAIHPSIVEGQIQGGVTQGIGWALIEGYRYDDKGNLLNNNMQNYLLPTCMDVPDIEPVLVEIPSPDHPYGVRGVGEVPIVPPPAAIANAIYQAVGARMTTLPMTQEKIFSQLTSK